MHNDPNTISIWGGGWQMHVGDDLIINWKRTIHVPWQPILIANRQIPNGIRNGNPSTIVISRVTPDRKFGPNIRSFAKHKVFGLCYPKSKLFGPNVRTEQTKSRNFSIEHFRYPVPHRTLFVEHFHRKFRLFGHKAFAEQKVFGPNSYKGWGLTWKSWSCSDKKT